MAVAVECLIRWMVARDMSQVMEIERASFDHPWTASDFHDFLGRRHKIGMVAKVGNRIAGFGTYELNSDHIRLTSIAVDPLIRRQGVGESMISHLKRKLSTRSRTSIIAETRETNIAAQLFLRDQGFFAERILRKFYQTSEGHEDAYQMIYRHFV